MVVRMGIDTLRTRKAKAKIVGRHREDTASSRPTVTWDRCYDF
jgi:hypothetical protein